jgi:hypothetical protein
MTLLFVRKIKNLLFKGKKEEEEERKKEKKKEERKIRSKITITLSFA